MPSNSRRNFFVHTVCSSGTRFISSPSPSQLPELMLPFEKIKDLTLREELKPSARRVWNEDLLKDYRKTASVVAAEPWRLFDAQAWLESLCRDNEQQVVKQPPPLTFALKKQDLAEFLSPAVDFSDLMLPEPQPPREVRVGRGQKRSGAMKRPAALKRPCAAPAAVDDAAAAAPAARGGGEDVVDLPNPLEGVVGPEVPPPAAVPQKHLDVRVLF